METLNAQVRDMKVKAKKLRRQGGVTGSISGRDMEQSLSLVMDQNETCQYMKGRHVGSKASLSVDGKTYDVLIKSADYNALAHGYTDITFQQLVADEKIKSKAELVYENEDKARGFLTHNLNEIEYKAYAADLVETIVIDVSKYPVGTNLTVADLDIFKNEKVDVLTAADDVVLHVADHQKMSAEDEAMIEADEEAAAEKSA